jgi:protein-L-isoaspartate(D-aspartate) O-methyltransferase
MHIGGAMESVDRSTKLRAFYARYVTRLGNVKNPHIERAFASVRRELFVGPAPWLIFIAPGLGYLPTPDDDPAFLYTNNLIALDHARGINNGQPSLHALCMDAVSPRKGQHVVQIGAGTGYYSAILAQLVGRTGRVHAFEIDPDLAAQAKRNLVEWPWIEVQPCSGTAGELPKADLIYVNAGISYPSTVWLDALRQDGQLLFPLQPSQREHRFGGMLLLRKRADHAVWPARFVCRAGFIPCQGTPQDNQAGSVLSEAFDRGNWQNVKSFHLGQDPDDSCWFKGDGWWLST